VRDQTRPKRNSLRLLPSGPDRVGEAVARADLSSPHLLVGGLICKPCIEPLGSSVNCDNTRIHGPIGELGMRAAEDVTFAATPLDRAAHLRGDLDALLSREGAQTIVLWRGKPLVRGDALSFLPLDHPVLSEAKRRPLFLGLKDEAPIFAVDISPWEPEDVDEEAMGQFFDPTANHHPDTHNDENFVELRGVMARLSPDEANIAATARARPAFSANGCGCDCLGDVWEFGFAGAVSKLA